MDPRRSRFPGYLDPASQRGIQTMFSHLNAHRPRIGRALLTFLVVATFVGLAAVPAAWAGTIEYEFSPNATITFGNAVVGVSGTFVYDTVTGYADDIDLAVYSISSNYPVYAYILGMPPLGRYRV